ncbi:MAG: glycosyltransferase [Microthrixaceae bacterium]
MRLVTVTSRFPYPIERGDKLRAHHQLRVLAQRHDVALIALSEGPVPDGDRRIVSDLGVEVHVVQRSRLDTVRSTASGVVGGRPIQVGYFMAPRVRAEVARLLERLQPDHLYCQLVRTAWANDAGGVRSTIDYQDAFAAAMRRRGANRAAPVRVLFDREADRIGRCERAAFDAFDNQVVISEQDRRLLEVPVPETVDVVPNGVDTDHFSPRVDAGRRGRHRVRRQHGLSPQCAGLAHVGGGDRAGTRGSPTVLLAGARPSRSVRRLAGPGVEVTGWMPDIRDAYARASVMVAPLFIGAGLQNKILEAMAMGVPCVTTTLVNDSIGAERGREIMVADNPADLAQATAELLESPGRRAEISEAARAMVIDRFSWGAVGDKLTSIFERR